MDRIKWLELLLSPPGGRVTLCAAVANQLHLPLLFSTGSNEAARFWRRRILNSHRFSKTLGAFALAILAVLSSPVCFPKASAQVSVLTNKNDNSRDGLNGSETLLSSANVNSNQFGKLFTYAVDGYVQAQPLYMYGLTVNGDTHNVAFVATENNSVYAIDADTGLLLWTVNLGPAVPSSVEGCNAVTGFNQVGITGTPVIDATTNTLYVATKTYVSSTAAYSLNALDVTTGAPKFGSPVTITAPTGSTPAFIPLNQLQRPGLLESNGNIYIAFGSNGCDFTAWGFLAAYSSSTLQQVAWMTTQPDQSYGSSIWAGGVGPAADSAGNVFLSTANGFFNYPSAQDWGDSVLRITENSGVFTVADYFTPYDQAYMAGKDEDLGSGGPTLLPNMSTTCSNTPDLLVTSGKDEDLYLINRDNMGGYNSTDNNQIVQYVPTALLGEFFGSPLYWNNLVYFLAHQDYLRAYSLTNNTNTNDCQLSTTPVAQTGGKLTNFGLPSISANGTTNGIVWLVRNVSNTPKLSAYNATVLYLLYDSGMASGGRDTLGTIGHFATPTIANGKVYMGTQTQLVAYGLFPDIAITTGNGQTGNAGTTLPGTLIVTASNPYTGAPIPGVSVNFSDGGKGGSFSNPNPVTGNDGTAMTTYTLPKTPQTVTITASSAGFASATFTETGVVGPVASITLVSGSKQTGTVGTTLPKPIVVTAKDAFGNLVSGASIAFTDNQGGTFNPNPGTTGTNGETSVMYTLPTVAKSLTVVASNGSVSLRITENSVAGAPALMPIIQGNNQSAHPNNKLPKTLIVKITDQYGNGIKGLTVTFTDNGAGGTFSTTTPVTATNGQATTNYTTGSTKQTVTITATYGTLPPATFTETVD
jgi:outer membrane protein assembly factor BamB